MTNNWMIPVLIFAGTKTTPVAVALLSSNVPRNQIVYQSQNAHLWRTNVKRIYHTVRKIQKNFHIAMIRTPVVTWNPYN